MLEITQYHETELSLEVARAIADVACRSFQGSGSVEQRVQEMLAAANSSSAEKTSGRRFVIWDQDRVIAHARTFVRRVTLLDYDSPIPDRAAQDRPSQDQTAQDQPVQELTVLALATVCSDPERRGQGLGRLVTQKAFEQLRNEGMPQVSLFQTPVPVFYEKLNCRVVDNRFVNRLNTKDPAANPWRDDTIMIHPAEFEWPEGVIDLNGPDY